MKLINLLFIIGSSINFVISKTNLLLKTNRNNFVEGLSLAPISSNSDSDNNVVIANEFYGMVYSPYRNGSCPSRKDIEEDIALMAPLTSHLHLYGMDCDQAEMILDSMNKIAPQATAMLGMWVRGPGRFELELEKIIKLLENPEYRSKVYGICVGNEELFTNQFNDTDLANMLFKVRKQVRRLGVNIPIFTTEIPKLWTPGLAAASDAILANIHPYFDQANAPTDTAAERVIKQYDVLSARFAYLNKPVVIAETGWPSGGKKLASTGIASPQAQETYLHTFLCLCHRRGIPYYLFEAIDSPWKSLNNYGDAERHFGLASAERSLRYTPEKLLVC